MAELRMWLLKDLPHDILHGELRKIPVEAKGESHRKGIKFNRSLVGHF